MADEVAQRENEEMEAMLAMMEPSDQPDIDRDMGGMDGDQNNMETLYGSDDDEYDSLFMDALQAAESQSSTIPFQQPDHGGGDDRMDES